MLVCSIALLFANNALYGSTTEVDIEGDGTILKSIFGIFLKVLSLNSSKINAPKPLPVPPPILRNMLKPYKLSQYSAYFLILSITSPNISFPIVHRPLAKLLEASSLPEINYYGLNIFDKGPDLIVSSITLGSKSTNTERGVNLW